MLRRMRHVLSSQPTWRFVKASYASGIKTPNVSHEKYTPWKYLSLTSKTSWRVDMLDISELDEDGASLLAGCEANTLSSVHMSSAQFFSVTKEKSVQLKAQNNVNSVCILGGTDVDDVSRKPVPAMFAFMARVFPNVDRIVLHFAMPCKRKELQELFEVGGLQRSFLMPY